MYVINFSVRWNFIKGWKLMDKHLFYWWTASTILWWISFIRENIFWFCFRFNLNPMVTGAWTRIDWFIWTIVSSTFRLDRKDRLVSIVGILGLDNRKFFFFCEVDHYVLIVIVHELEKRQGNNLRLWRIWWILNLNSEKLEEFFRLYLKKLKAWSWRMWSSVYIWFAKS